MNRSNAETAVVSSALIVGAIYGYRKLVEGAIPPNTRKTTVTKNGKLEKAVGYGELPPVGQFITGWGFAFVVMALITQVAPSFGGSLAILAAVSDVLGNGTALAQDIGQRVGFGDPVVDYPTSVEGGIPVLQPGETGAHFDKRLHDYLIQRSQSGTVKTNTRTNPLTTNPFTQAPNPLIR